MATHVPSCRHRLRVCRFWWIVMLFFLAAGCDTFSPMDEKTATTRETIPMTGLFRYMADAARFTLCSTGEAFPVAMEKDYLALERAYLEQRREPGADLLVSLAGHFERRPPMEGDGLVRVLIVDRFDSAHPGTNCPSQPAATPLGNTTWKLIALYGEPIRFTAEGRGHPHLRLSTPERQVSGFSGCNNFFGLYRLDGERLSFEDMAGTMRACPNNPELEQAFYRALKATRRYAISGSTLELCDSSEAVARLTAVVD